MKLWATVSSALMALAPHALANPCMCYNYQPESIMRNSEVVVWAEVTHQETPQRRSIQRKYQMRGNNAFKEDEVLFTARAVDVVKGCFDVQQRLQVIVPIQAEECGLGLTVSPEPYLLTGKIVREWNGVVSLFVDHCSLAVSQSRLPPTYDPVLSKLQGDNYVECALRYHEPSMPFFVDQEREPARVDVMGYGEMEPPRPDIAEVLEALEDLEEEDEEEAPVHVKVGLYDDEYDGFEPETSSEEYHGFEPETSTEEYHGFEPETSTEEYHGFEPETSTEETMLVREGEAELGEDEEMVVTMAQSDDFNPFAVNFEDGYDEQYGDAYTYDILQDLTGLLSQIGLFGEPQGHGVQLDMNMLFGPPAFFPPPPPPPPVHGPFGGHSPMDMLFGPPPPQWGPPPQQDVWFGPSSRMDGMNGGGMSGVDQGFYQHAYFMDGSHVEEPVVFSHEVYSEMGPDGEMETAVFVNGEPAEGDAYDYEWYDDEGEDGWVEVEFLDLGTGFPLSLDPFFGFGPANDPYRMGGHSYDGPVLEIGPPVLQEPDPFNSIFGPLAFEAIFDTFEAILPALSGALAEEVPFEEAPSMTSPTVVVYEDLPESDMYQDRSVDLGMVPLDGLVLETPMEAVQMDQEEFTWEEYPVPELIVVEYAVPTEITVRVEMAPQPFSAFPGDFMGGMIIPMMDIMMAPVLDSLLMSAPQPPPMLLAPPASPNSVYCTMFCGGQIPPSLPAPPAPTNRFGPPSMDELMATLAAGLPTSYKHADIEPPKRAEVVRP